MGFVNEKIEEKDRERYNSFNLIGPYTGDKLNSRYWTIDRERDEILVGLELGRDEDQPDFYVFIFKNKVVKIQTHLKQDFDKEIYWDLYRISMPESLKEEQEIVIEDMIKAFKVYGYLYDNSTYTPDKIFFTNIAKPTFYKEEK